MAGSSTNVVEVFSYAGGLVGTVNHVDDPTVMLLVGPTLYVTGDTNGVVTAIDTKTLTTKVVASGLNGPSSIAFTDKRLWVSLLTPRRKPAIVSIALKSGQVHRYHLKGLAPEPVSVASSPGDPDTLFVTEDEVTPSSILRYAVSAGGDLNLVAQTDGGIDFISQTAVSPDGTKVITAGGQGYDFEEFLASTLQPDGTFYPGNVFGFPEAVAISNGNGGIVAVGTNGDSQSGDIAYDISVFPLGNEQPILQWPAAYSQCDNCIGPNELALSDNGVELAAVTASDELLIFKLPKSSPT